MTEAEASQARRQRLESKGKPIPEYLLPPDIMPGAEAWLEAFWELSTDRQLTGYGHGPVPAASIDRHTVGWPDDEAAMFRACIRAMDAAFLKAMRPDDADLPESDNPARDAFRAKMR